MHRSWSLSERKYSTLLLNCHRNYLRGASALLSDKILFSASLHLTSFSNGAINLFYKHMLKSLQRMLSLSEPIEASVICWKLFQIIEKSSEQVQIFPAASYSSMCRVIPNSLFSMQPPQPSRSFAFSSFKTGRILTCPFLVEQSNSLRWSAGPQQTRDRMAQTWQTSFNPQATPLARPPDRN